jgi:murein L,D-transpeptidase YafK
MCFFTLGPPYCPEQAMAQNKGVATRIVIKKGPQTLEVFNKDRLLKKYRVCLGMTSYGHKQITGDQRTPVGDYYICYKSRRSDYHAFMGLSYPGINDAKKGYKKGLITRAQRDEIIRRIKRGDKPPWNTRLGGWVGIHGYPSKLQKEIWTTLYYPKPHNWTDGCIAMWSKEIKELYSMTPLGTPVRIHDGQAPPPGILFEPRLDLAALVGRARKNFSLDLFKIPKLLPESPVEKDTE